MQPVQIADILVWHKVKANRYTYHNLSKASIAEFRKTYKEVLILRNKYIPEYVYTIVKNFLNNKAELDYAKKLYAMKVILNNISL